MEAFLFAATTRLEGKSGTSLERAGESIDRAEEISLRGAKNSYLSFQLGVKVGSGEAPQVSLHMDNPGCGIETAIFDEWFHQWEGKLIPDLLIPLDRMDGAKREKVRGNYYSSPYRVYWIDCFLPKELPDGVYGGKAEVTCGSASKTLSFELEAEPVTLCSEAILQADFNNYADAISRNDPALFGNKERYFDGSYLSQEREFFRLTHEHRAFFHYLPYAHSGFNYLTFAPKLEGSGKTIRVSDWTAFDNHFGPYLDGSAFEGIARGPIPLPFFYLPFCFDWPSSYEIWGSEGYRTENRRILADFIRHFEDMGWTETVFELFLNHKKRYRFYPYDGDEVRHQHDEELARIQDEMFSDLLGQSRVQIVLRTDSSWSFGKHYDSDMNRIFRFWAAGSSLVEFYPDSFALMLQKGNYLFEYTGVPTLEAPLTSLYKRPARCLMNGAWGILYWNTTGVGDDYLTCPVAEGSEVFLYPSHLLGLEGGALPSLRMKYHRNAMQTMDLIAMFDGTEHFSALRQAVNDAFGTSDEMWTSPLPASLAVEPHLMTNDAIGDAERNDPGKNMEPDLPDRLLSQVLELAKASGLRFPS